MGDLETMFSLNNWPGHLSYVLMAVSYWLTNMFWLRVVAVIGLSLEILYFWLSAGDLRTGIGWDLIFIGINLFQIYQLVKDRLFQRLILFGQYRAIGNVTKLTGREKPRDLCIVEAGENTAKQC